MYTSGLHVPVKLPPFDPKQPKRWFQQADAIFRRSHVISSQDKWDYVLPKLPTDVLNDISDVVDSLTDATPNPYELAKNRLLETYTPTRWQLAWQLLAFPHVTGVRPTTLMNQLLSLLPPGDHPETMFMLLYLDRLPPNISAQLTAPHLPQSAGHGRLRQSDLGQYATTGRPCSGGVAGSTAFCLTRVHSLHAVCLSLHPQS